jgi:dihydroorotate dehydrogenase electron transfer subunit
LRRYFRAEIADNRKLSTDCSLLTFVPFGKPVEPRPGQFIMIGIEGDYDPLLKRPFSVFRRTAKGFQILYRVRGRGTSLMRNLGKGSVIHVLGPLGNSYPLPPRGHAPVIVAGGIGVASVFSLAEKLAAAGKKPHLFYGARDAGDLLVLGALKSVAKPLSLSTDDGSCGERGCVTDMLGSFLDDQSRKGKCVIYACGPRKMLETVSGKAAEKNIEAYVSLEENMACGIGACLGCVVKTVDGHKRVCREGPVFAAKEIVW